MPSHLTRSTILCMRTAALLDAALLCRCWSAFIGYSNGTAEWWYFDAWRDAVSWNLRIGNFEMVIDRPYRPELA
ncbi:hypothetical protein [Caldimonas sp. KR1-144]|uniref:hypothetical protein n=1 Tax=Caldimonas sp. KR1-144 TaxID=3400911 RepID=UPI003BFDC67F